MKLFVERFPTVAAGLDVEPQHVALALHRLAVAGQQDVVSPHLGRAAGRLLLHHPLGQQVPGDGGLRDRPLSHTAGGHGGIVSAGPTHGVAVAAVEYPHTSRHLLQAGGALQQPQQRGLHGAPSHYMGMGIYLISERLYVLKW